MNDVLLRVVSLLTHFIFQLSGHSAEPVKNNPTAANTAEVLNAKQGSSNLLQEQPRLVPVCARLSSPPHPYYGYVQLSPRMRSFNPAAPPNVTIGPQGFHRMMIPEQTNWFLRYSPLDSSNFSQFTLSSGNIPCSSYSQRLE